MRKLAVCLAVILLLTIMSVYIDPCFAAVIFEDGFESGDYSNWTGNSTTEGATISASTAIAKVGSYSSYHTIDDLSDQSYAYKTITDSAEIYCGSYVYIDTFGATGSTHAIYLSKGKGDYKERWRLGIEGTNRSLKLKYYTGSTPNVTAVTSSTTLNLDTWHWLEIYFKQNTTASNGQFLVYLDGTAVSDLNFTGVDTADYDVDMITSGTIYGYGTGLPATFYIDRVIANTSYIGPLSADPEIDSVECSVTKAYFDTNFEISTTITDSSGISDFKNCTITLDDDWSHTFTLLWDNSTNTFSEYEDISNYCSLQFGTRTTVNSTAYTLGWTFLIRDTFPEGYLDIVTTVYDSSNGQDMEISEDLFSIETEFKDVPGYTPPLPIGPTNQTIIPEQSVLPGIGGISPGMTPSVAIIIIVVAIIIVAVKPPAKLRGSLKRSQKTWRKTHKKREKAKHTWTEKDKKKRGEWRAGEPWD